MILHVWLGHHESNYALSATTALWHAGFDVVRLLPRDHRGTDRLNEVMFNSAMLPEVINALRSVLERHGGGCAGVLGYSLGGIALSGFEFTATFRIRSGNSFDIARTTVLDWRGRVECDFGCTAALTLLLPRNVSFTSDSGVFLRDAGVIAVDVPAQGGIATMALGLLLSSLARRRAGTCGERAPQTKTP